MPKIGVDMLFVAKVTKDDEGGAAYGSPIRLPGLNNIGYDPSTQSATYDADDGTYTSYSADGASTATIKVADLLSEHYALLLGLQQDGATGVIEEGMADNPPEFALGWRSQKSDGSYRFIWLLKGKFAKSSETYATKGGSGVTYNDRELTFTALNRTDGKKRRQLDSDDPKLPEGVTLGVLSSPATGWFSNPDYVPGEAPEA